ncbi:DNA-binding PucR family transcriptional regulator [Mycolicibacterium mucogenicum 261Sha1.1M5]|nr:DNA-binding PucR family transcriptional regulator [Mycolicibacterium mucogenicum 261Sha1.1M5]
MIQRAQQSVTLRTLLAQPMRIELTQLCAAADSRPVRNVVVISDIDEITSIEPDTVVLLSADVARGSWMVSAALRYAWERNACALIVPERLLNPSVVQLAERFQVSLFTTPASITAAAIEVASGLGFARAQLVSTLHRLTALVETSEQISEILALASEWLEGAHVELESAGAVVRTATSRSARGSAAGLSIPSRVSVPVGVGPTSADQLVTEVQLGSRERAAAVLEICATKLRALLAEAELAALHQSLPVLGFATLTGSEPRLPKHPAVSTWLDRPEATNEYVVVCILSEHIERHGAALHQVWLAEFRGSSLIRATDGWLAVLPVQESKGDRILERVRHRLGELHLLDLRIGESLRHVGQSALPGAIREAWLAARVAEANGQYTVVRYGEIPVALVPHLLPPAFARDTLELRYPDLFGDAHRDELIRLYTEYAAHLGSTTETASALGIHRNTVKQRLERLQELGVPVHHPEAALGLHLLFAGFRDSEPGLDETQVAP